MVIPEYFWRSLTSFMLAVGWPEMLQFRPKGRHFCALMPSFPNINPLSIRHFVDDIVYGVF